MNFRTSTGLESCIRMTKKASTSNRKGFCDYCKIYFCKIKFHPNFLSTRRYNSCFQVPYKNADIQFPLAVSFLSNQYKVSLICIKNGLKLPGLFENA